MAFFLGAVYIILLLGDFFETHYAVSRWGHEVESNPFWQVGFSRRSKTMDWLYIAGAFTIGIISYGMLASLGLVILIIILSITNINNIVAIFRMHKNEVNVE